MGLEETLLVSLEEGETNHRGLILYWGISKYQKYLPLPIINFT